jgi:hypothetical protein
MNITLAQKSTGLHQISSGRFRAGTPAKLSAMPEVDFRNRTLLE